MNPKRWQHLNGDDFELEPEAHTQRCEHPDCNEAGEFRAPKTRATDQAIPFGGSRYWLFCIDHVRAYNQSWNYYDGMSDAEIAASQRADLLWNRATHPFGNVAPDRAQTQASAGFGTHQSMFNDPFEIFDDFINDNPSGAEGRRPVDPSKRLPREIRHALELFDLKAPVSSEEVKKTYKKLAKRYHPDLNGGSTKDEERLKAVNDAYQILKEGVVV